MIALVLHDDALGRMDVSAASGVRDAASGKLKQAQHTRDTQSVRDAGRVLLAADARLGALGIRVTGDRDRVTVDGERRAPRNPSPARGKPSERPRERSTRGIASADARTSLYGPQRADTDAGRRAAVLRPQLENAARQLDRRPPSDPDAVADRAATVRKELGL